MKVLVTGGAGFIGSHLVDRLLKEGCEVTVIDNLNTGKIKNLPKYINFYKLSVLDNKINNLFKDIDIVFHLAALTRPRESEEKLVDYYDVNVDGTGQVLSCCSYFNVKKVIFVSSASAYGFQEEFPINEKAKLKPASRYADTKLWGENLIKDYCRHLKINIVRPFNVYGKRQDPNGPYGAAIPKFIDYLKRGKQPFITGDGKQFRDFVYVDDVVDLLIRTSETKISRQTFNAGSGKSTTINQLYRIICRQMGKNVKPKYVEEIREPNTEADITKAKKMLGWKPKFSLEEGLKRTI